MEDRLVNLVRRRMDFTIRTTDSGVRQCFAPTPFNSRFRSHALITHGTLQKAELFCEIRMVHGIAVANRRKCDGRLLLPAGAWTRSASRTRWWTRSPAWRITCRRAASCGCSPSRSDRREISGAWPLLRCRQCALGGECNPVAGADRSREGPPSASPAVGAYHSN